MTNNILFTHVGPCRVDPNSSTTNPHHERTPRRGVRGALGYGISLLIRLLSELRYWWINLIGQAQQGLVQVVGVDPCRTSAFFQYSLETHGNQPQGVSDSLFRGHGSLHRHDRLLFAGGVDREVTAFDLREAGIVPLQFDLPQDGRVQRVVRGLAVGARPEVLFARLLNDRLAGHGLAGVGENLHRCVQQAELASRFAGGFLRRYFFLRLCLGGFCDGFRSAGLWLSCWCVLGRRFQLAPQSVLTRGSLCGFCRWSVTLGLVRHLLRLSRSRFHYALPGDSVIAHDHELPRRAKDIHSVLAESDRFTAGLYAREWARKCYLESVYACKKTIKQAYHSPLRLSVRFHHSGPAGLHSRPRAP